MTDDSYKLANDRELIEMRRGAVEDLAEYRDNLEAIDGEINRRGLRVAPNDVEDEFAPGECDGSSACVAPIHVHGCYRPHRADQCDSPDEYGHIVPQGEPSDAQVEAAARAILPLFDATWPYYEYEEIAHKWLPEARTRFNDAIRAALRAAESAR